VTEFFLALFLLGAAVLGVVVLGRKKGGW